MIARGISSSDSARNPCCCRATYFVRSKGQRVLHGWRGQSQQGEFVVQSSTLSSPRSAHHPHSCRAKLIIVRRTKRIIRTTSHTNLKLCMLMSVMQSSVSSISKSSSQLSIESHHDPMDWTDLQALEESLSRRWPNTTTLNIQTLRYPIGSLYVVDRTIVYIRYFFDRTKRKSLFLTIPPLLRDGRSQFLTTWSTELTQFDARVEAFIQCSVQPSLVHNCRRAPDMTGFDDVHIDDV